MFQITDGTFAEARKYGIRDHHNLQRYLIQIDLMKNRFARLAAN